MRPAQPLDDFVRDALDAVLAATGARSGYLELYGADDAPGEPGWWASARHHPAAIDVVRRSLTRGELARAMAAEGIAETPSTLSCALEDGAHLGHVQVERAAGFTAADRRRLADEAARLAPRAHALLDDDARADPLADLRGTLAIDGFDGGCPALRRVLDDAADLALLDDPVLVSGALRTGKRVLARTLHQSGRRAGGPCLALHEAPGDDVWASPLDGALRPRADGLEAALAAAAGGTLVVLHPEDFARRIQSRLLHLVTHGRLDIRSPRVDVRLVIVTHDFVLDGGIDAPLVRAVGDLLADRHLAMPSIEERRDDVPAVTRTMCRTACDAGGIAPIPPSRELLRTAAGCSWPANFHGLHHALSSAVVRAEADGADEVQVRHLLPTASLPRTLQQVPSAHRHRVLADTLHDTSWDLLETARRLDLRQAPLHRLIRDLRLAG